MKITDEAVEAMNWLKSNQRQLDADGCEVGVSRQALDAVISAIEALTSHERNGGK